MEMDPTHTCERCEEGYALTARWDDECYCEDCCKEVYPEYWKLMTNVL